MYSVFNLSCRTPRKLNFKILNFKKKKQTRKSNQRKKWGKKKDIERMGKKEIALDEGSKQIKCK